MTITDTPTMSKNAATPTILPIITAVFDLPTAATVNIQKYLIIVTDAAHQLPCFRLLSIAAKHRSLLIGHGISDIVGKYLDAKIS